MMGNLNNRNGASFHCLAIEASEVMHGLGIDERSMLIAAEKKKADDAEIVAGAGKRSIFTGYLDLSNKPIYIGDILDHYHFGKKMRTVVEKKQDAADGDQYCIKGSIYDA